MLPSRTTVLIVGAGPTGLAAALPLLHQGCRDLIIVDSVPLNDRPMSSRALGVQAATLEALDTIGCAEPLIKIGTKCKFSMMWNQDGRQMSADYDCLNGYTRYPYMLIVSQYSTEKVLDSESKLEEMGIAVQRPYRLIGLDDGGGEGLIATFESGERIKANYVLGADGARSAVRNLVKVGFADPDGENIEEDKQAQMVIADVTFTPSLRLPRDRVNVYNGESGSHSVLISVPRSPWPESYDHLDDDIFRIGFTIPKEDGPPPHAPSADFLQKYIEKIRPTFLYPSSSSPTIKIDKLLWSSRFRIHFAIADQFLVQLHSSERKEVCRAVFLMGDAAHIHSPLGGQGMNLGLRDAIGLSPILFKHIQLFSHDPQTADNALKEYAVVRRSKALNVIALTKRSTRAMARLSSTGWIQYFLWIFKLVFTLPFVKTNMIFQLNGLGN